MRKFVRVATAALVSAGVLAVGNEARADEPTTAAPAATPTPPAPTGADAPAGGERAKDPGRLRIGFNFLGGGYGTSGSLSGPVLSVTFRAGYQINRLFGVYGNITPFVWAGTAEAPAGAPKLDVSAMAGAQFTPIFSVTPLDFLELGAGPSADYIGGGSVSAGPGAQAASTFSGTYFGMHGKVAFHLGSRNAETGRRKGFTIEGNLHPTFTSGATSTFMTAGLGYDWH